MHASESAEFVFLLSRVYRFRLQLPPATHRLARIFYRDSVLIGDCNILPYCIVHPEVSYYHTSIVASVDFSPKCSCKSCATSNSNNVSKRSGIVHPASPMQSPYCLLSEESPDPPQYAVLLWIIWVILARYLQHRRECICIGVDLSSNPLCNLSSTI